MKVSVVIAILNSHEIVRRQILWFRRMGLDNSVEFIFMDDGSDPPLENHEQLANFRLIATNDYRNWTQGLARMKGVKEAKGEFLFMTDIDHIISREAMDAALSFTGDKMVFQRRFAYLDEEGNLVRDRAKLLDWGLNEKAIRDSELSDGFHGNTWLIRKSAWELLGGYSLKRCESGLHIQGEDREFNRRYRRAAIKGKVGPDITGPPIYFFPSGRFHATGEENPHGLFHDMTRDTW